MRYIKGKDLNLLMIFAALWRERNVTAAAKVVGISQPALSRSLSRLRDEFGDPLFVRSSHGVTPTQRAIEIAESIVDTIASLDKIYSRDSRFDPANLKRVFTLVSTDYFESIAAERLIPIILKEAPQVSLNFRTSLGVIPKESLESGDVDLTIVGIFEKIPEGFYHQKILEDHYRSVVRSDHPMKSFSVDSFTKYSHVLMTPSGDLNGIVDDSLGKLNKSRHIAIGSSNFLSAGWMVAKTDLILTAPGLVVEQLKDGLPLRDFKTPVPTPRLDLYQIWHARTHHDPAQKWLRSKINEAFKN
jgi:DNA-binding transcriptional LysR family regulator